MSRRNSTHSSRLARALSAETKISYLQALTLVKTYQEQDLLPSVLDKTGTLKALSLISNDVNLGEILPTEDKKRRILISTGGDPVYLNEKDLSMHGIVVEDLSNETSVLKAITDGAWKLGWDITILDFSLNKEKDLAQLPNLHSEHFVSLKPSEKSFLKVSRPLIDASDASFSETLDEDFATAVLKESTKRFSYLSLLEGEAFETEDAVKIIKTLSERRKPQKVRNLLVLKSADIGSLEILVGLLTRARSYGVGLVIQTENFAKLHSVFNLSNPGAYSVGILQNSKFQILARQDTLSATLFSAEESKGRSYGTLEEDFQPDFSVNKALSELKDEERMLFLAKPYQAQTDPRIFVPRLS